MIHILQLLCPERHAILAIPYDADHLTEEQARTRGAELMRSLGINHLCGICGSTDLHWEDGKTKWHTLEEAAPQLAESQAMQMLTRMALDQAGLTHDAQRNN